MVWLQANTSTLQIPPNKLTSIESMSNFNLMNKRKSREHKKATNMTKVILSLSIHELVVIPCKKPNGYLESLQPSLCPAANISSKIKNNLSKF